MNNIDGINNYIDNCNIKLSHYDMAFVLSNIYKNKYRYLGKQKWEYYDETEQAWKEDNNKKNLKYDIKLNLSDMFMKRSLHWFNLSYTVTCVNLQILYKMKADKLLHAANFLKDDKYISTVIKEAGSFFDIHIND